MNQFYNQSQTGYTKEISREFFRDVYSYMFGALAISGLLASYFGTETFFNTYFKTASGGMSPLLWIVILAPLALGLIIGNAYNRLSYIVLLSLFILYSALMGIGLSVLFLNYDLSTLSSTFFITSGAFAAMAILGYTTKTDLSSMGSLLYMALSGMIIAIVVNLFMHSEMLDYLVSIIGVFVFTGLTAYHMQNLKHISTDTNIDSSTRQKIALVGGFTLYLLFINLFMTLLRLIGNRD